MFAINFHINGLEFYDTSKKMAKVDRVELGQLCATQLNLVAIHIVNLIVIRQRESYRLGKSMCDAVRKMAEDAFWYGYRNNPRLSVFEIQQGVEAKCRIFCLGRKNPTEEDFAELGHLVWDRDIKLRERSIFLEPEYAK